MLAHSCLPFLLAAAALAADPPRFYPDDPLVRDVPPRHVEKAKRRKISDYYDFFRHNFATPGELSKKLGRAIPAANVNTLGEVPDGEWYTSRHYFQPMTVNQLLVGPGNQDPPSMDGKWQVLRTKTEGITPGLRIRDSKGRVYQIKFDPLSNPEISTSADVIGTKLFHALGYHVPQNYLVYFHRSQLQLSEDSELTDNLGRSRKMTGQDLAEILLKVPRTRDGRYRAVASLFLNGADIGPFRFYGTRADDPNDTVPHEHHRELRGYRLFCAWVDHDDSRSINTIDFLMKEGGKQFIRHHLIDFGSILGSASNGPNSPRSGNEYVFSWGPPLQQFFTLGLYVPKWAMAKYPHLKSVGRFESKIFDPEKWVPEYPNPAFLNMTDEDAFWAARQVMAFTNDQIRAIVNSGGFSDPRAEKWISDCLMERRDKIGKAYLTRVLPLDRFRMNAGKLEFEDLAVTHKLAPPVEYGIAWADYANPGGGNYRVATISGRGKSMKVYVRNGTEVVGITR